MMTATLMTAFEGGLLYASLGAFGGATIVGLRVLGGSRRGRALRPVLAVGLTFLSLFLIISWIRQGEVPVAQRHEVLLVAAWGIGLGAWYMSRRTKQEILAAVTSSGLSLVDVSTEESDLEDIFLKLTRGAHEAEGSGASPQGERPRRNRRRNGR